VEFVATLAPVPAVPLAHRRDDPAVRTGVVLAADRKLPADLRLPVDEALTGIEGADVQGATGPPVEAGPVEKDACALGLLRHQLAVLVLLRLLVVTSMPLPLLRRQSERHLLGLCPVLLVDEVGTVGTTPLRLLRRRAGEDAEAATTEDAGPRAEQERDVEDPRDEEILVVEGDPLVGSRQLGQERDQPLPIRLRHGLKLVGAPGATVTPDAW
jgi:hypothetical protein